ncbi:MAG: tetratricopeptide repeat protein [Gaiellaceae bacterium]
MPRDGQQSVVEAFLAAQAALDAGDRDLSLQRYREVAERWLSEPHSDDQGERLAGIGAASMLGTLLFERGEPGEAERWWRQAAEAGTGGEWPGIDLGPRGRAPHADAASNLGDALGRRGELDEALRWVREAADYGHATAATTLGAVLYEQGSFEEAARWWRQAAEQGSSLALYNLGTLAKERGDLRLAEGWFRRAAGAERLLESAELHAEVAANAASEVGALLAQQGEVTEARGWLVRAGEGGSEDANEALAHLEAFERTRERAETWLATSGRAASDDFLRRWRRER